MYLLAMKIMTQEEKIMDAKMDKQIKLAQKQATKMLDKAQVQLKQARKNIEGKIKTNPHEAMLIASAIGVAVGALATYGILNKKKK
jgi:ElaB/YqjD/DUF883 family membrane-anchored ribosome-binding protein